MKKFLFAILSVLFLIPFKVNAETFYFNHGEYNYSNEYIESSDELEVEEVFEEGKLIYRYRTRDYLIIPDEIVIYTRNMNIFNQFNTNLKEEELILIPTYDLDTMNYCYGYLNIYYKDKVINKSVYIAIENYLKVPEEIIVKDYDFDIWNYIETDIENIEEIKIIGEYNLDINGEYEILFSYNNVEEKTKIVVDIDKNKKDEEVLKEELIESSNDVKEEIQQKETTTSYVNNYYKSEKPIVETKYIEKLVPIDRVIYETKTDENNIFLIVTYGFYIVNTILLSIIVVRKK